MTELVILSVLFFGAVIGWMIRHWSARRQFAEHNRHRQLEQLQDLSAADAAAHGSSSPGAMARFNTDGNQSLESRLLELEEENSDLTKHFISKEREVDELFQTASLVKPLEFELELATDEIRRLNLERDHQLSVTQAAIYSDDTQAVRVAELEQQLEIAQQEIEANRDRATSLSHELDATIDARVASDTSLNDKVQALLSERDDLESANNELLDAREKSEAQKLELSTALDDIKQQSIDFQHKHTESVSQIDELQEKIRIRDIDLQALNERIERMSVEHAEELESQKDTHFADEVSRSRGQDNQLRETEEKLKHFDSTLARLSDLESELGSSSQRSEEMIETLQSYKEQNEQLTDNLRQHEIESESLKSEVESKGFRASELEKELNASQEMAIRSEEEITRLSQQNKTLLEQNRKFKQALQSNSLENKRVEEKKLADLQQSTKEINQTNRKLEDTRKALADSERELLEAKAEYAERETHLSNSAARIVALTAESKKSESQLQSRNSEIKQLEAKLTALQNDFVAEKGVSEGLRKSIEENSQQAEKQIEQQRAGAAVLDRKMAMQGAVAKNRADSLVQLQSHWQSIADDKDENIRTLESTNQGLAQWRDRYAEMEKKLVLKDVKIKELDSAVEQGETAERENVKLVENNNALQNQKKSLDVALEQSNKKSEQLVKDLNDSKSNLVNSQQRLSESDKKLSDNAVEIDKLNTQIAEARGRTERLQEKNTSLAKSTETQSIALEKSGQNVAELKSQLSQTRQSLDQVNQQTAEIPVLKETIEAFQKENSDMRLQINRISNLETSIKEKDALISQRGQEKEALISQHGQEKEALIGQHSQEKQQIGEKVQEDLARKDSKIQTLEEKLLEKQALEQRLQEAQTNLVSVEQQANRIPAMQATLRDRDELIIKLNKEAEGLKSSREQDAQTRSALQKQLGDKSKEIAELHESTEQLRQARQQILVLQEQTKDTDRLRLDIAEKNRNLTNLKERNISLDTEFKKLASRAEEHKVLEASYRQLENQHMTLKESSTRLQAEREKLDKRLEAETEQRTQVEQRLETVTTLHTKLEKQIESADSERIGLQSQLDQSRKELENNKQLSSERDTLRKELQQRLDELTLLKKQSAKDINDLAEARKQIEAKIANDTGEIDKLNLQASTHQARIAELESLLKTQSDQASDFHLVEERLLAEEALTESLTEAQKEHEIEMRRMQSELEALRETRNEPHSVKSHQKDLAESRKRIAELEAASRRSNDTQPVTAKPAANAQKSPKQLFQPSKEKDDLKKIYGIGPVMEKTLNGLGISSYKQIADFTKSDIERVADAIESFSDRIERDDWVGGARKCYDKKYGSKA